MRIYRSSITPYRSLDVDEEVSFKGFDFTPYYPLLGIEGAHLQGEITKENGKLCMAAYLTADLCLADARDNQPFYMPVTVNEYFTLLENEDDNDEEGYVFPNNLIEPRDICFALLRGYVPIKPLRPGSKLPEGGDGYSVYEEGQEPQGEGNPFEEALAGLDLKE